MKAFLVRNRAAFPPFQKPASQLRFKEGTVESRLKAQLRQNGFEVVETDAVDPSALEPGSIVVQDDLVLSSEMIRRFFASVPDRLRNYQCEIDAARFPLFSAKDAAPSFRELPLYYYGDPRDSSSRGIAPLRMTPPCVHEVAQGLPVRMHMLTEMRAYFLDFYGLQLEHWFDLQTASSLYCRELVVSILRPVSAILPASLVTRITSWAWLMKRCNSIGKNSRIHPTAILEGCVVGDGVEIGPYSYLRASVIGDGAVIREHCSMKMSFLGEGGFLMRSDIVNSYIGAETAICAPMLYNVVFGERGFLSGGSGFADFIVGAGSIAAAIGGQDVPSNLRFLGSAVGDDCFLGANLIFSPGRTIPDGTRLLDNGLIKSLPTAPGGTYVLSGSHLLQVPTGFIGGPSK